MSQSALEIWRALIKTYSNLKDIYISMVILAFFVGPLYKSKNIIGRSPGQMQSVVSYLANTSITLSSQYGGKRSQSAIHKIPWDTITNYYLILFHQYMQKNGINHY